MTRPRLANEHWASIHLTDWGVSLGGEHYSIDIMCDRDHAEVDQVMTDGLAGRLNKKDGTRMNRPGDKTLRFETRESAIKAGVKKARELWPHVKLVVIGGLGNPDEIAWAENKEVQAKMNVLHEQMEGYYKLSHDPWGAGYGTEVDKIYAEWDRLMSEFEC